MAELPRLRVGLTLDSATFIRETNRVIDSVNRMGRQVAVQNDRMQRSFNQVTSSLGTLKAAFAGFGISTIVNSLVEAEKSFQRINNALRVGTGSAEGAAREFTFVRSEAQRLGLSLEQTATQYSHLAAAAQGTALQGQATRDIFSAIAEASSVLGLSVDQTEGALRAIQQMISKGNVQSEELRGQLGERLPGAFQIAARAMGVTTQELDKMLKKGELTAVDLLPKLTVELRKAFGPEVPRAAQGLQQNINRLQTAFFDFRRQVSEGGVAQAVGDFAKQMVEVSKASGDLAKRIGADLGAALRVAGAAAIFAAEHFREVTSLIVGLMAYKVATFFLEIARALTVATGAMLGFNTAMRANPIGVIATAIAAAVALIYQYRDAQVEIGGQTRRLGDLVKTIWEGILEKLKPVLGVLKEIAAAVGAILARAGLGGRKAQLQAEIADIKAQIKEINEGKAGLFVDPMSGAQLEGSPTKPGAPLSDAAQAQHDKLLVQLADKMRELKKESLQVGPAIYETNKALIEQNKVLPPLVNGLNGAADATGELAAKQKRLAEAGKILLTTSAQEERFALKQETDKVTKERDQRTRENARKARKQIADDERREAERKAKEQQELMLEPFKNAAESIQATFADTFTNIFEGGVSSFADLGNSIKRIFMRLAGEIAALMVIRPVLNAVSGVVGGPTGMGQQTSSTAFSALGGPSAGQVLLGVTNAGTPVYGNASVPTSSMVVGPGGKLVPRTGPGGMAVGGGATSMVPGQSTPGGIFGTNLTGGQAAMAGIGGGLTGFAMGSSMFGGTTGSKIGGTVGGAAGGIAGAAIGSVVPVVGTVIGGMLGSMIGGIGGSFIGSLFGGGGGGARVANIGGVLGTGGQGPAGQFAGSVDQQLQQVLTATQESVVNAALATASSVRIEFSKKKGLSENDKANIARQRIGTAAGALGIGNVGAVTAGSADQQMQNFQTALGAMQAIQKIQLGPLGGALKDVNDQFGELTAQAYKYGLSLAGVYEEQSRQQRAVVENWRMQAHAVMLAVGATNDLGQQLGDLDAQMNLARIEAERMGISVANSWYRQSLLADQLVQNWRIQQHAVMQSVGLLTTFEQQWGDLDAQMRLLSDQAQLLGISTEQLGRVWGEAAQALARAQQRQLDQMALSITDPFKQLTDQLRDLGIELDRSLMNPLDQYNDSAAHFRDTLARARRGELDAINELDEAGRDFIATATAVGASPAQADATREVQKGLREVLGVVASAQAQASRGLESTIWAANQRVVDTLGELVQVGREQIQEMRRLQRGLT